MTLFLLLLAVFTVFGALIGRKRLIRDVNLDNLRKKPGYYAIAGFLGYNLYTSPFIPGDKLYILPQIDALSFRDFKMEPTYAEFGKHDLKMAMLSYELQLRFPANAAMIATVT